MVLSRPAVRDTPDAPDTPGSWCASGDTRLAATNVISALACGFVVS
jgi:hypothetical protein